MNIYAPKKPNARASDEQRSAYHDNIKQLSEVHGDELVSAIVRLCDLHEVLALFYSSHLLSFPIEWIQEMGVIQSTHRISQEEDSLGAGFNITVYEQP